MMAAAADNKDVLAAVDEDEDGDGAVKDGSGRWWQQRKHSQR